MSFQSGNTFVYGEQPTATKWDQVWRNDDALSNGSGIVAGSLTGNKLNSGNMEVLQYAPVGNQDGSATSMTDWITIGNATIPSWCTSIKLICSMQQVYPVTATNTMTLRVKVGSDAGITILGYSTNTPVGTSQSITIIDKITPSATGPQSVTVQQSRTAGSNGIRADVNSDFEIMLFYR